MGMTVEQWEESVIDLWRRAESLDREDGVAAMRELAAACPATDGRAAFELAGMYDSMGFEVEAGAEYERALALGLDDARHAQLAVQYGSTLRNLGRLDEAIAVLRAAPTHPSTGSAPRIVLALALHSAGKKDEALQVALDAQIGALPRYQRSMTDYAAALTEPTDPDPPARREVGQDPDMPSPEVTSARRVAIGLSVFATILLLVHGIEGSELVDPATGLVLVAAVGAWLIWLYVWTQDRSARRE